jgi:hypothetical protein
MKNNPKLCHKLSIINQIAAIIEFLLIAWLLYLLEITAMGLFIISIGFPVFVTQISSKVFKNHISQIIALAGLLLYGLWVIVWYAILAYRPDAQNGIALLFTGIYALPVMSLFWGSASLIHTKIRP